MKLLYPNKTEIESKKIFVYKINNKEYLFYTSGEASNGLSTVCFGELKDKGLYAVAPEDTAVVTEFIGAFANNKAGGNPNYVLQNDRIADITVYGGSKTQLPENVIAGFKVPEVQIGAPKENPIQATVQQVVDQAMPTEEQIKEDAAPVYKKAMDDLGPVNAEDDKTKTVVPAAGNNETIAPVVTAPAATSVLPTDSPAEKAKAVVDPTTVANPNEVPEQKTEQPAAPTEEPKEATPAPVQPEKPAEQPVAAQPAAPATQPATPAQPKKKGNGGLIAVVLILLIALAAGYYFFFMNKTSPTVLTTSALTKLSENVDSVSKGDSSIKAVSAINQMLNNDKVKVSADLELTAELGKTKESFTGSVEYIENKADNLGAANVTISQGAEETSAYKFLMANKKLYFNFNDAFKNYYYTDYEYEPVLKGQETVNYSVFVKLLSETINEQIKDEEFKSSDASLTISGETVTTTKYSYEVNAEKYMNICNAYIEKVKSNDEAVKIIMNLADTTKEEVVKMLDESKITDTSNFKGVTYNVYAKSATEPVKYSIENSEGNEISYTLYGELQLITVKSEDETVEVKIVTKGSTQEYTISYAEMLITASYNKDSGDFAIKAEMGELSYNVTGNYKETKVSDTEYDVNLKVNVEDLKDTEGMKISCVMNAKIKTGDKIDTSVINNAKSVDNMSKADMEIYEEEVEKLQELLGTSSAVYEDTDYDTDYDMDYEFDFDEEWEDM